MKSTKSLKRGQSVIETGTAGGIVGIGQIKNWGCKSECGKYFPIMTDMEPAPPELLNVIRCKCKKVCNAACSYKRNGLKCVSACTFCKGMCENTELLSLESEVECENTTTPVEIHRNIFDIFNV